MIVRELLTRLGFIVDKRGADQYEQKLNEVKNLIGYVFGAFSIRALAQTADAMQSLEGRISQLPQTVTSAGDAFNAVGMAATQARQPIKEFGDLYVRLANSTRQYLPLQQDVLALTQDIAKTFVIGGLTATEQASAMLQLSQAFNKGKLDGDEFRTVMEAMPGQITRALAKAMGYETLDLFYKAREQGELTVDKLIKAFQALRGDIESQFQAMPLTISQGLTIVGNRFSMFVQKLNRESGAVTAIAGSIIDFFDTVESGLDKIVEFFGSATNALKAFGTTIAVVLAPTVFRAFGAVLSMIVSPLAAVAAAILSVIAVGEDLYVWIKGGRSLIGDMLGDYDKFMASHKNIAAAVDSVRKMYEKALAAVVKFWEYIKAQIGFGEGESGKEWFGGKLRAGADWLDRALAPDTTMVSPALASAGSSLTNNVGQINITVPPGSDGKAIGEAIKTELTKPTLNLRAVR